MENLDKASDNFKPITQHSYKRYRNLDCESIQPLTLNALKVALRQIGSYITSIKFDPSQLIVNDCHQYLKLIFEKCNHLENISVKDVIFDLYGTQTKISTFSNRLKSIELINCEISENSFSDYLETVSSLERLSLHKINKNFFGSRISKLKIPNLVSLNLSNCRNMHPDYFANFCSNNTNLVQLKINRCKYLTTRSVIDITQHLFNLEEISFSSFQTPSKDLLALINLPKLKKLQIKCIDFLNIDDLLIKLAKKDLLELLAISECLITEKTIEAVVSFNKLKVLKIKHTTIGNVNKMITQLGIKGNLKELYVRQCYEIEVTTLILFIENSTHLRVLDVSNDFNITNNFYNKVTTLLKQQNRQHSLTVFVAGTQIKEHKIMPEEERKNLLWIKLNFSGNLEFNDDYASDSDENDESDEELTDDEYGGWFFDDGKFLFVYFHFKKTFFNNQIIRILDSFEDEDEYEDDEFGIGYY